MAGSARAEQVERRLFLFVIAVTVQFGDFHYTCSAAITLTESFPRA